MQKSREITNMWIKIKMPGKLNIEANFHKKWFPGIFTTKTHVENYIFALPGKI